LRACAASRPYQFTAWVIAAVVAGMLYPEALLRIGRNEAEKKWIRLLIIQLVMFGMGTQMSLRDFTRLGREGYAVFVGSVLHFTIMPLVGYALAIAARLPPEIAAGVVLIGSCSSGLASNVMNYLAGGNLPLSITLTALSTMMAPLMTPLWMMLLAGSMVPVHFVDMMLEILKIMIVPLGAALLHDYLASATRAGRRVVATLAAAGAVWLAFLACGGWKLLQASAGNAVLASIGMSGFLLVAVLAGAAYHALVNRWPGLPATMPRLSMFGIVYFTAITTAKGRDELLVVGWLLLAVAIAHNTLGYSLGYWLSRLCGLDKRSARTVAMEVGLQNGGMATGIASQMNRLGTVGLAAAIFSPWMNVSGSVLANYWRKRPAGPVEHPAAAQTPREAAE
jgi:BASS family bile acid:Na+ symporter